MSYVPSRTLLALALLIAAHSTARAAKPTPCAGGRFVVQDGPLLSTAPPTQVDFLSIGGSPATAGLSIGCAAADLKGKVRLRAGKKGTKVSARWHDCAALGKKIRLTGLLRNACQELAFTLKAKKLTVKRTAVPSTCGDGIRDVDGGEACDPQGVACSAGATCSAQCACSGIPATESFSTSHVARLDITQGLPNAGTITGIALLAIPNGGTTAQVRISAPQSGGSPVRAALVRTDGLTDAEVASIPFPTGSSTVVTEIPFAEAELGPLVGYGQLRVDVFGASGAEPYAIGPILRIPSAVAPEPSADQVVPPATSVSGVGSCVLTVDPDADRIFYTVYWLDLDGAVTSIRIGHAAVGADGPTVFDVPFTLGSEQTNGVWNAPGDAIRAALLAGEIYVEFVTDTHPDGELRGQIYPQEWYTAALSPENEAPPLSGVPATGTVFLDASAHGTIEVFDKLQGVVGELSGPITVANIYGGAIGATGPVLAPLQIPTPSVLDLELAFGSAGGPLSDATMQALRAGNAYVNVTTAGHTAGEVRGQLIPAHSNLHAP